MFKSLLLALAVSAPVAALSAPAFACDDENPETASAPAIVSPEQVNALIAAGATTPVDANNPDTRANYGVLPGAILLSSHEFAEGELPADHDAALVFYCGSERCSAAPSAAATAIELGYTNVSVMSAGIRGWVEAGYETQAAAAGEGK